MDWDIEFYRKVDEELAGMPPKIQARMIRLMELMEKHGANLGEPHTKSLGDELFEIRAKAKEGIGRGIFCYMQDRKIIILHVFVKKDQKIPKKDLELAKERLKEVKKVMSFKQFKQKALENPEVRKEYDALQEEFNLIDQLITMRTKAGLTQEDLAKKMGTSKSNISRLERGRGNPSWGTLSKYAAACGFRVKLETTENDRISA